MCVSCVSPPDDGIDLSDSTDQLDDMLTCERGGGGAGGRLDMSSSKSSSS